MCQYCSQGSGRDQEIAYLKRVIADQEKAAAQAQSSPQDREALQKARQTLAHLLKEQQKEHP